MHGFACLYSFLSIVFEKFPTCLWLVFTVSLSYCGFIVMSLSIAMIVSYVLHINPRSRALAFMLVDCVSVSAVSRRIKYLATSKKFAIDSFHSP